MRNITLSIPDELLRKSREYAQKQGKSLNDMVRELLKKTIDTSSQKGYLEVIENARKDKDLGIDTLDRWNRDELYNR